MSYIVLYLEILYRRCLNDGMCGHDAEAENFDSGMKNQFALEPSIESKRGCARSTWGVILRVTPLDHSQTQSVIRVYFRPVVYQRQRQVNDCFHCRAKAREPRAKVPRGDPSWSSGDRWAVSRGKTGEGRP